MKDRTIFRRGAWLLLSLLLAAGLSSCAPAEERSLLDYQDRITALTMNVTIANLPYTLEMTAEHGADGAKTTVFTVTAPEELAGVRLRAADGSVTAELGDGEDAQVISVLSGENSPLSCLAEAFALKKEWLYDAQSITEDGVLTTKLTFTGGLQPYVLTMDDGGLPKRIEFETAHTKVRADITKMELDENG